MSRMGLAEDSRKIGGSASVAWSDETLTGLPSTSAGSAASTDEDILLRKLNLKMRFQTEQAPGLWKPSSAVGVKMRFCALPKRISKFSKRRTNRSSPKRVA